MQSMGNSESISTEEFYNTATDGSTGEESLVVLDVRTEGEIEENNITKLLGDKMKLTLLYCEVSQLCKLGMPQIADLGIDKEKDTVLCFCRSGGRSGRAQSHLLGYGFKAVNVSGGINAFSSYVNNLEEL